jgi:orotate phosphoribosyltransferase
VALTTLTDYEHVIEEARATGYIREEEVALLQQWRKDPAHWNV